MLSPIHEVLDDSSITDFSDNDSSKFEVAEERPTHEVSIEQLTDESCTDTSESALLKNINSSDKHNKSNSLSEAYNESQAVVTIPVDFLKKGERVYLPLSEAKALLSSDIEVLRDGYSSSSCSVDDNTSSDTSRNNEDHAKRLYKRRLANRQQPFRASICPLGNFAKPTISSDIRSATRLPIYNKISPVSLNSSYAVRPADTLLRRRASMIAERVLADDKACEQQKQSTLATNSRQSCTPEPRSSNSTVDSMCALPFRAERPDSFLMKVTDELRKSFQEANMRATKKAENKSSNFLRTPPLTYTEYSSPVISPKDHLLEQMLRLLNTKQEQLVRLSQKLDNGKIGSSATTTTYEDKVSSRAGRLCEKCGSASNRQKPESFRKSRILSMPTKFIPDIDACPWSTYQKSNPERLWISQLRDSRPLRDVEQIKVDKIKIKTAQRKQGPRKYSEAGTNTDSQQHITTNKACEKLISEKAKILVTDPSVTIAKHTDIQAEENSELNQPPLEKRLNASHTQRIIEDHQDQYGIVRAKLPPLIIPKVEQSKAFHVDQIMLPSNQIQSTSQIFDVPQPSRSINVNFKGHCQPAPSKPPLFSQLLESPLKQNIWPLGIRPLDNAELSKIYSMGIQRLQYQNAPQQLESTQLFADKSLNLFLHSRFAPKPPTSIAPIMGATTSFSDSALYPGSLNNLGLSRSGQQFQLLSGNHHQHLL